MNRSKKTPQPVRHAPHGGPQGPDSRHQAEIARSLSHRRLGFRLSGGGPRGVGPAGGDSPPETPGPSLAVDLFHGDALAGLGSIPDASVDAVISDPPYPCVQRSYGVLSEARWRDLMDGVVAQCRRILRPGGSAVFILQPNSERVGRVRPWLFEFMAQQAREWNLVQDAWWWNPSTPPNTHTQRRFGLLRTSVKACVWLGAPDCFRAQDEVLWTPGDWAKAKVSSERAMHRRSFPSGYSFRKADVLRVVQERGGSTPFNLIPMPGHSERHGHPAATPFALADWWTRYLVPNGGTACDPFLGSGTMAIAALRRHCSFVGVEQHANYIELAGRRIEAEASALGMEVAP